MGGTIQPVWAGKFIKEVDYKLGKVSHFLGSVEGPCGITQKINITVYKTMCIVYDSDIKYIKFVPLDIFILTTIIFLRC